MESIRIPFGLIYTELTYKLKERKERIYVPIPIWEPNMQGDYFCRLSFQRTKRKIKVKR